jgi:hypothetical protein
LNMCLSPYRVVFAMSRDHGGPRLEVLDQNQISTCAP